MCVGARQGRWGIARVSRVVQGGKLVEEEGAGRMAHQATASYLFSIPFCELMLFARAYAAVSAPPY